MSISKRKINSDKPYPNKGGKYRYKCVFPSLEDGVFYSQYVRSNRWKIGEWLTSKTKIKGIRDYHSFSSKPQDNGFHVYVKRNDCIEVAKYNTELFVVLEVKNFNASGTFDERQSETWKKARIVAVYRRVVDVWKLTDSIPSYKGQKSIYV